MKVTVRLYATLRRPTPTGIQNQVMVELEEGATVAALLKVLPLPIAPEQVMVLSGLRRVYADHPLRDGDEVQLFPPISGGIA